MTLQQKRPLVSIDQTTAHWITFCTTWAQLVLIKMEKQSKLHFSTCPWVDIYSPTIWRLQMPSSAGSNSATSICTHGVGGPTWSKYHARDIGRLAFTLRIEFSKPRSSSWSRLRSSTGFHMTRWSISSNCWPSAPLIGDNGSTKRAT